MSTNSINTIDFQPGLINIKPVPTESASVEPIDNSEIRKIAEDVVDAVKYSLTATAANPDNLRGNTIEADFASVLSKISEMRPTMVDAARTEARALIQADEQVRLSMFGRHGAIPGEAFAANGFERALEDAGALKVDAKLLGLASSLVSIPVNVLRPTDGGMLIPSEAIRVPGGQGLAPSDFQNAVSNANASALETNVLDQERMESVWGSTTDFDPFEEQAPEGDFLPQAAASKLGIYVRRVKCEDETNPEWPGNDKIALGGISTDENGDVKKINETFVGSGFKDGRSKNYSNWQFHWFNLNEERFWPKKYGVSFVLAEKDHGGLSRFLNKLWLKVRGKVKEAIEKALKEAGGKVGAILGSAEAGKVIGRVLGKAVAWAVDKLAGWLIRLFRDDIFRPATAWLTVPSAHARWHYPNGRWGNPWSGLHWFRFSGHGGRYLLQYQWRLYS